MTNLDEEINRIYVKIADAEDDWFNDRTINPRQIAIDEIKALIANQVKEAVKEEKAIRVKLVTKAHKDGIADGLQMALYGVKDGSKEEKFIRHLLYSENIGNKENE